MKKKAILIVSFGTSYEEAAENSLDRIFEDIQEAAGAGKDIIFCRAYTSGMILKALRERGIQIPTVKEALEDCLAQGMAELIVVPTHMIPGLEYQKMKGIVAKYQDRFQEVRVTDTVLQRPEDCDALTPVLRELLQFEPEKEYILMGHGTEDAANIRYEQMNRALERAGLSNVRIASVEARPDLEDALQILKERYPGAKPEVILHPFMVVAGDHARKDMAGAADSYLSCLREQGFPVRAVIKGLGEYSRFRRLYVDKLTAVL